MSEETQSPVMENTPPVASPVASQPVPTPSSQPKVGPADDLREIQMLLVRGMFPGEVAPMVVKGFQFLDKLATTIEASAKANVPQK
jgi:hypothetical protein